MSKILIFIDQMQTGGAGRVTSTLLHGLVQKGYDVVMALDNVNCSLFYPIAKEVRLVTFDVKNNVCAGLKQLQLVHKARRIIKAEKPDVIISVTFFPFFYAHYAALFTSIPVIAYDHTSFARNMGKFINWIRYSLYGKADRLVILTQKDERLLGRKFPRKEVVYNPLTYPIVNHTAERQKIVLCAGRVDSWNIKGFDCIIEIWSHLSPHFPEWKLQIAGDGNEKGVKQFREMVLKSGVADSIEMLGQVSDMPSLYAQSAIFALPSRVEGFPMVLLEAMSQGCVCCSFEMGGAVNEMMSNKSGIIVQDGKLNEFEEALRLLMNRFPDFYEYRKNGSLEANRFTCDNYYDQWDNIIKKML